jgi:hypothetical protein
MSSQEYLDHAAELSDVPAKERRTRTVAVLERMGPAKAARRRTDGPVPHA